MSGAQSISTRRAYGVQRVCRVWHRARSSVYARRQATRSPALCRRRGPIGAAPDDVLVAHIRRVLEASPFHGEGYRKAWAKLRVAGMRTSAGTAGGAPGAGGPGGARAQSGGRDHAPAAQGGGGWRGGGHDGRRARNAVRRGQSDLLGGGTAVRRVRRAPGRLVRPPRTPSGRAATGPRSGRRQRPPPRPPLVRPH